MTREAFIEMTLQKAHEAWDYVQQGQMVDLTIIMGRREKETGEAKEPMVHLLLRGRLDAR